MRVGSYAASFALAIVVGSLLQSACTERGLSTEKKNKAMASTPLPIAVESPLQLKITLKGAPSRRTLRVAIEVLNRSKVPVGWDQEFAISLLWRLDVDNGESYLEGCSDVEPILQADKKLSKERFIKINPGARVSKVIDLAKPHRQFKIDPQWKRGFRHPTRFRGYETLDRFDIPPKAKVLTLRLEYQGNWDSPAAFKDMFGFDMAKVHLWHGSSESNLITLKFQN